MSSSFFPNSHGFHIENGTFVAASKDSHHRASFDPLCENIAEEAMHNSGERYDAPKVHPETRKAVQEEIFGWIKHGDEDTDPKKILWVSGPAGAGKSAIAGSIAELCDEEGLLAGSFFFSSFSGSQKRRSKKYVVATLAYCLLQHDSLQALRKSILSMIERDPKIFGKTLRDQSKAFLLRPFYDTLGRLDLSVLPKVIILDGLDEVQAEGRGQLDEHEARRENEADQQDILAMLLRAAEDPKFPFRIIVFSRPERVISHFFGATADHVSRQIFLDEKYDPDSDIELFLRAKFAVIRRRFTIREGWPSRDDIKQLVVNASGQFIYAATVIRFLESGKRPDPQTVLRSILVTTSPQDPLDALAPLDSLYTRILMSSPDPALALRWICVAYSVGVMKPSAWFIRRLCRDYEGQEAYLLESLASLVRIPHADEWDEYAPPYGFYHKSMLDFLRSPERCGKLLNDSYKASMPFFRDRWHRVLKAPYTLVPLRGQEWECFVFEFWRLYAFEPQALSSRRDDLLSCNMAAWISNIITSGADNWLEYMFRTIHETECGINESLGGFVDCSEVCRYWRSAILGECKRLGWETPSQIDLLLERVYDLEDLYGTAYDLMVYNKLFQPANRAAGVRGCSTPVPSPCCAAENLAHRQADLEKYEALLATLQTIWQALPTDWVNCCKKFKRREELEDAVKAQLRRVPLEVRLQMEGLGAWLNEGWSGDANRSEETEESDSEETEKSDPEETEKSDSEETDESSSEDTDESNSEDTNESNSEETTPNENSSCSAGEGSERDQDRDHSQHEGVGNIRTEPHLPQLETARSSSRAVEVTSLTFENEESDPQEADIAGGDSASSLDIQVPPIHDPFPSPHLLAHPFALPKPSESGYKSIPPKGHATQSIQSGTRMTLEASFPRLPPLDPYLRFPSFSPTSPRRSLGLESTSDRLAGERFSHAVVGNGSRYDLIPWNDYAMHSTSSSIRMTLEASFPRLPPLDLYPRFPSFSSTSPRRSLGWESTSGGLDRPSQAGIDNEGSDKARYAERWRDSSFPYCSCDSCMY